ncbi:hypothetical protein MPH_08067 [Macrophomina phaseolina MS6]|uniref:Uncharacterized protein n=1 Tax=Macrophomina phaseolina (strain MS6) TaxID=1126212 RepID=K2RPT6_MACPH|nr:hypothetical protein MPH_08067 [Macrophomina phaseolina MS6]
MPDSQSAEWKLQRHRHLSPEDDSIPVSFDPLAPDDTLFRTKNAPIRYEEDDIYFAHRYLASHQILPDSDLLKALHAYTSDFYSASFGDQARRDWRSMDETALLALGILIEEAAVDILGETGDLAFVEGEDDGPSSMPQAWTGSAWTRSVIKRGPPRPGNKSKKITNASEDMPSVGDGAASDAQTNHEAQPQEADSMSDSGDNLDRSEPE